MTGMAISSEVSLTMAMVSLPVGGTITRIACGSTTRRIALPLLIPSAQAASRCPSSTDRMPARAISAMYAASERPRPMMPPMIPVKIWLASSEKNVRSPSSPSRFIDLLPEREPDAEAPWLGNSTPERAHDREQHVARGSPGRTR